MANKSSGSYKRHDGFNGIVKADLGPYPKTKEVKK
jgi:hypothetical protein